MRNERVLIKFLIGASKKEKPEEVAWKKVFPHFKPLSSFLYYYNVYK